MKKLLLILTILLMSTICFSQYKEFVPGPYRIGDTVQVSSKNSLFKAVKNFTAYSIPSDNQYWDFAGNMFEERLKLIEKEIAKQKATNLLFSESIAAIEDKIDVTPTDPVPVPTTEYLSLPLSPAKFITGQTNVVIENLRFESVTDVMLYVDNCSNVTIKKCSFIKGGAEGIVFYNVKNVLVDSCLFSGVTTGVYASTSQGVKVKNSQFVNMRQRSGPARGQFVQFDYVTGAGNEISGNKGENFMGESDPEDMFSLFKSSGTEASPIQVRNNWGRGGGSSLSGGGIVLGDYGGSYAIADGNVLHTPGQYGMAIAGGHYMTITNNKIFSKQTAVSNNPLFIWAQQGATCSNNVIKNNRASWIDKTGAVNGGWNAGNCTNTVFEYPAPITEAELNMPEHLIDFITPDELLKLRGK